MSIPTSLIVVILVAAWLAVLVPMVARRREQVPETEADGGTFRVLRRASASIRRRPTMSRRNDREEDDITEHPDGDELLTAELDAELLDDDLEEDDLQDDDLDEDVAADDDLEDEDYIIEEAEVEHIEEAEFEGAVSESRSATTETVEWEAEPSGSTRYEPRGSTASQPDSYETDDDATYDDDRLARASNGQRRRTRRDPWEGLDDERLRPVPHRPGRGGFDPDAAEVARAYRYSRRRRIAVVLLLATIAFSAAAYLFKPVLWGGTAVFGLLLIAYLAYLRRQVRFEKDIRERRLARLRRARQIRPEYHPDQADAPITGSSFGAVARGPVPVSQVPAVGYRRGREIVDLEDDDPAFEDLEYYEPLSYRRASGQ